MWWVYFLPSADVSLIHHFSNCEERRIKYNHTPSFLSNENQLILSKKVLKLHEVYLACQQLSCRGFTSLWVLFVGIVLSLEVVWRSMGMCWVLSYKHVDVRVFPSSWLSSSVMSLQVEIQADRLYYLKQDVDPVQQKRRPFIVQGGKHQKHHKAHLAVFFFLKLCY